MSVTPLLAIGSASHFADVRTDGMSMSELKDAPASLIIGFMGKPSKPARSHPFHLMTHPQIEMNPSRRNVSEGNVFFAYASGSETTDIT